MASNRVEFLLRICAGGREGAPRGCERTRARRKTERTQRPRDCWLSAAASALSGGADPDRQGASVVPGIALSGRTSVLILAKEVGCRGALGAGLGDAPEVHSIDPVDPGGAGEDLDRDQVSSVASRVMPRASGQIWRMMAHICAMDAPFMRRLCDMACRIWPHGVRPSEGGRPAAAGRVEFPHRTGSGPVTRIVQGTRTDPRGETTKRT